MVKAKEIYNALNSLFDFGSQNEWDNSGFLIGSGENLVGKACLCLDVTKAVAEEAEDIGADLIISHHPAIFKALKALHSDTAVYKLICADIGVISVHTPFDKGNGGVSEALAEKIGLQNVEHLEAEPIIMLGEIPEMSVKELSERLKGRLGGRVLYSSFEKKIKKVAICPGSGASLLSLAASENIDAFITGDAGHHDFIDCEEAGIALFACGHFETEFIALASLEKKLSELFPSVEFCTIEQKNPIKYI